MLAKLSSVNGLDLFLIGICLFFFVRGILRGGIFIIFGSAGFLAAFFVSLRYYTNLAIVIHSMVPQWKHPDIVAFVLLFFLTWFSIGGLGHWLGGLLRSSGLKFLDRFIGAIIGTAIGVMVSACVVFTLTIFLPPNSDLLRTSRLAPYSIWAVERLYSCVPPEVKKSIKAKHQKIKKIWCHQEEK
ncbi:MAG: CvpA family protein [Deltaproteobacteria bacterium]|nr:CvpA family protein [Deltaproteobacteria bacterium]MBW2068193.1 CvpA family protein [Deltaproteobacteria bacterium]